MRGEGEELLMMDPGQAGDSFVGWAENRSRDVSGTAGNSGKRAVPLTTLRQPGWEGDAGIGADTSRMTPGPCSVVLKLSWVTESWSMSQRLPLDR